MSERSGSASSGMFRIDQSEPSSIMMVAAMTRYLLSAEKRMMALIMKRHFPPGVRNIPHFGQRDALSSVTSGCIGQA